jgi:HEAT repeats
MADSTFVCKAEVMEAAALTTSAVANPPHLTATARLHVDRCFKGTIPPNGVLPVLFDSILPSAPGPYMVLRKGDYRLFFLKPKDDKYVVADTWFCELPISRLLGPTTVGDTDSMHLLELDLKAGLHDGDPERVLDGIRMLGNMRHLQSTAELLALLDSPDALMRTHAYEALLRLHDYSVLSAVDEWLETQPQAPHELFLPRDALFEMQFRLGREIASIRDPATVPVLVRLLHLQSPIMRGQVLQALRAIRSPQSAPSLLQMLDDPDADNGFGAMQGLIELAAGGVIDWVPSWPEFRRNPTYYAARCREWWQTEGQQKAAR